MSSRIASYASLSCMVLFLGIAFTSVNAQESLHQKIDRLIVEKAAEKVAEKANGPLSERSTDAEFLRRVWLDFAGHIPSADTARKFLEDTSPDKRQRVIDELLASENYSLRMADLFNVMLIERRSKHDEWIGYLRSAFAANKPWDQMVREIIDPNADDEKKRGAALFYTARLEHYGQNPPDVPGLVRDVGRMFLGVDVGCAQCHDHLFVDDYKQIDYQGLFAFVGNTTLRQDVKFPAIAENPLLKKVAFKSVFASEEKMTGPRLPGGPEIEIPDMKKGEEYSVPPDKKTKTPGVLKFSPVRALSDALTRSDKPEFARNISNRLWWAMMGRGLVEPLDLHHAGNPASHPELLELLATEIVKHKFDIKWFLRELALTDTYQRSSLQPEATFEPPSPSSFRTALERPISSDQWFTILREATGEATTDAKTQSQWRERFDKIFANPPKEPELQVAPTVKAALFLSNDSLILSWFERREGNLVDRLCKMDDPSNTGPSNMIEEAYLSVLTRMPTKEDRTAMQSFLERYEGAREKAIGQIAWALAASTEFSINH